MKNDHKTKEKLLEELKTLRAKLAKLEKVDTAHARYEEELRKERDRAQRYLDVAGVILLSVDSAGNVTLINRKGCQILGYEERDILGKNWFEHFVPERLRREVRAAFLNVIANKDDSMKNFENPVLTRDGKERVIAWHNSFLKNKKGDITAALCSGEDITEQKLSEKNLLESEAKYRAFFDNTGTAIAIIEESTVLSLVNSEFERLTGYGRKELEGKMSWADIVRADDREKMKEYHRLRRVDPANAPRNYEFHFINKNGDVRDAYLTVAMIPGTNKSLASLIDITEWNNTARALAANEKRFKELWDNAPIAYHILDAEGTIIRVNQTEVKLLGYTVEDMLGKPIFDFILPEQRDRARERFAQKLAGRSTAKSENRVYIRKDGSKINVSIDDVLERDNHGKVIGVRTTMVDMTERKKAEEDLMEQKDFSVKLIQNSTTPTFVLDSNHTVLMWNKACEKLTGINESNLVNTDSQWKAFFDEKRPLLSDIIIDGNFDDIPKYYKTYEKSDILSEGLHSEQWFKNLGGKERYIVFDAAPVYNSKGELIAAIETLRDITDHKRAEEELERSFKKLQMTLEETVNALASTAEKRDSYTAGHQHRVTQLACAIARELKLPEAQIEGIRVASTLHDIGKIYVPAEILNKPGRLIDLEMGLIKIHPKVGYDILKTIPFSWPVAQIVLQHHERIDGSGYPLGLSGGDIFLEARILGVADVVEAIAFHRPYRENLGIDKALEEISVNRGILYDPNAVDACLKLFNGGGFRFQ